MCTSFCLLVLTLDSWELKCCQPQNIAILVYSSFCNALGLYTTLIWLVSSYLICNTQKCIWKKIPELISFSGKMTDNGSYKFCHWHRIYFSWAHDTQFRHLGTISISDKTSYHKISWSLQAAKLTEIIISLWNLTDTSTALLSRCLSFFEVIVQF